MKRTVAWLWITALIAALAGCGGGGGVAGDPGAGSVANPAPESTASPVSSPGAGTGTATAFGTLRVSLTDNPACGYDEVWVTVERVRVHRSSTAGDGDAGWVEIALTQPLRVDLLTLTNGTLVPLGQVELPAGTYTQMRLVLADNGSSAPWANAVKPTGGSLVPLTTPSAQQSGLKLKVNMTVPPGQEADFAIDFDACKSIHTAGKSGKTMLKPVLSVIPMLHKAGQRIQGWLHPSLVDPGTTVSVQVNGEVVRATPPLAEGSGKFILYPVPVGTYDLVVTSRDRVTAIVTGVPSSPDSSTTVNSEVFPINPPLTTRLAVGGQVTAGLSAVDTGGVVRALQTVGLGPIVEVAQASARPDDGIYGMLLPVGAPVTAPYVPGAAKLDFVPLPGAAGRYQLSATVARSAEVKTEDIVLDKSPVIQDFHFGLSGTQLIQGWLAPALAVSGTTVSVQVNGEVVLATPPLPDGSGKFVLQGVPVGAYDLVVTSADRVTAVVTGVPSSAALLTTVNSPSDPISPVASKRLAVGGEMSVGLGTTDTGGLVRAQQTMGLGPIVEVARANADVLNGKYAMSLPADAPVKALYVEGAAKIEFLPTLATAGRYRLWATVARSAEVKTADIVFDKDPVLQDFRFVAP